jgi:hypothetical protein
LVPPLVAWSTADTTYIVIPLPTLEGAVQLTTALSLSATTVVAVGVPGTPYTVTSDGAAVASEV